MILLFTFLYFCRKRYPTVSQNFGYIKKVFDFHKFWVAHASTESLFPFLLANIHHSYILYKSMHGGADGFSSERTVDFLHSDRFCVFPFKHSDVSLCRWEEVAPCFLWILNLVNGLYRTNKPKLGYLIYILLNAFQFPRCSDLEKVSKHIAELVSFL